MIIHADMDAFYASVEIREQPELASRPVAVGGPARGRGVISAANYIARRRGVRSAMPTATALKLCPELVLLPGNMRLYAEIAEQIREIFNRYTPLVEPLSLDEAFLDVGASEKLFGSAQVIGLRIKQEILRELRLTASIGIAPNKFLAKIASDVEKPDGFVCVAEKQIQAFLDPLPVERVWGVGKVTAAALHRLGIRDIRQLRRQSRQAMQQLFGQQGEHLWLLAHGRDERPVVPDQEAKSISHETTFAVDIRDREVLLSRLLELTELVAMRLRRHGLKGRTVHLKARFHDFTLLTRAQSLDRAVDQTQVLWQTVQDLFKHRLPQPLPPVRLIGMGVSGFAGDTDTVPVQADLFTPADTSGKAAGAIDKLTDTVNDRFGLRALRRARGMRGESDVE